VQRTPVRKQDDNTADLVPRDRLPSNPLRSIVSKSRFLELSCRKHLLEKRKNGNYSPDIVQGIFILRINQFKSIGIDIEEF